MPSIWEMLKATADEHDAKTQALESSLNMPPGLLNQAQAMGSMGLTTKQKAPFSAWEAVLRVKDKAGYSGVAPVDFIDEIRGLNKGHALYRAKQNWPDLDVEVIGRRITPKPQSKLKY